MIKEEQLLEKRELREQLASRVEVLEKVKALLLIPQTDFATLKQVAEFYEASEDSIKKIVARHNDELLSDGLLRLSGSKTKEKLERDNLSPTNFRGYFEVEGIKFSNKSNVMFPRRAMLRVGMLLRDSKIAKEVRTQLLNVEEKTSKEIKIQDIDEEQKLAIEIGMNYVSGNLEQFAISSAKMMAFKNRHIEQLQQDNKALTGEILQWKDRAKMNHAIRKLAGKLHKQIGVVWNELYQNLYYQYSISVKARGGSPYIQHIKENEWGKVIKTFSAICTSNDISPSEIFSSINSMMEVSGNAR